MYYITAFAEGNNMKYAEFEKRLKIAMEGVSANEIMAFFEGLGYEFEEEMKDAKD